MDQKLHILYGNEYHLGIWQNSYWLVCFVSYLFFIEYWKNFLIDACEKGSLFQLEVKPLKWVQMLCRIFFRRYFGCTNMCSKNWIYFTCYFLSLFIYFQCLFSFKCQTLYSIFVHNIQFDNSIDIRTSLRLWHTVYFHHNNLCARFNLSIIHKKYYLTIKKDMTIHIILEIKFFSW